MTSDTRPLRVFVPSKDVCSSPTFFPKGVVYVCQPNLDDIASFKDFQIPIGDHVFVGPFPVSQSLQGHQSNDAQDPKVQRHVYNNTMAQLKRADLVYVRIDNLDCPYDFYYSGAAMALSIPVFVDISHDCPREQLNEIVAACIWSVERHWEGEFLPDLTFWKYTPSEWTKTKYLHYLRYIMCD